MAAALPSCCDGVRSAVVWRCTGGVDKTERKVNSAMKILLIVLGLPFVRFVTGAGCRREDVI